MSIKFKLIKNSYFRLVQSRTDCDSTTILGDVCVPFLLVYDGRSDEFSRSVSAQDPKSALMTFHAFLPLFITRALLLGIVINVDAHSAVRTTYNKIVYKEDFRLGKSDGSSANQSGLYAVGSAEVIKLD